MIEKSSSMSNKVIIFDLDDTLYKEIDFVESAFGEIAEFVHSREALHLMMNWFRDGKNVFEELNNKLGLTIPIQVYLNLYRNHVPNIGLQDDVKFTLCSLSRSGARLGIITDGRRVTQWNKIKVLGLLAFIHPSDIVVSEEFGSKKPSEKNYLYFMDRYPYSNYYYVGDNLEKDFIAPSALGWRSVLLLDDGRNIHKQELNDFVDSSVLTIENIKELLVIL